MELDPVSSVFLSTVKNISVLFIHLTEREVLENAGHWILHQRINRVECSKMQELIYSISFQREMWQWIIITTELVQKIGKVLFINYHIHFETSKFREHTRKFFLFVWDNVFVCMIVWLCDCLIMWLCDSVIVWLCDYLIVWLCDYLIVWLCDYLIMWLFDCLIMWLFDCLIMWLFDCLIMWLSMRVWL
jgi:hypothetical protein